MGERTAVEEPRPGYEGAVAEFLDYLKEYRSFSRSTVKAYGTDLRMLREFLEKRLGRVPRPTGITRELIVQFGVSLRGAAPLTLRRKYACISSFFGFLQDMGYLQGNPARRLPLPRVSEYVPVYLTEEMAQQLISAADSPWTKAMVVLLLSTGIRRSEAVGITLDDLDLEQRQLLIRGKGDKERVVPLTEQAVEAIQAYLPHRTKTQSRQLFVSAWKGQPIQGRGGREDGAGTAGPLRAGDHGQVPALGHQDEAGGRGEAQWAAGQRHAAPALLRPRASRPRWPA